MNETNDVEELDCDASTLVEDQIKEETCTNSEVPMQTDSDCNIEALSARDNTPVSNQDNSVPSHGTSKIVGRTDATHCRTPYSAVIHSESTPTTNHFSKHDAEVDISTTTLEPTLDEDLQTLSSHTGEIQLSTTTQSDELVCHRQAYVSLVRIPVADEDLKEAIEQSLRVEHVTENELVQSQETQVLEQNLKMMPRNRHKFLCPFCSTRRCTVAIIQRHVQEVHKKTSSAPKILELADGCCFCGKKYYSNSAVIRHERECKNRSKVQHKIGQSAISKMGSRLIPGAETGGRKAKGLEAKISASKIVICVLCKRSFDAILGAMRHIKFLHKEKATKSMIRVEDRSRANQVNPKCSVCTYTAKTWRQVYKHIRSEHPNHRLAQSSSSVDLVTKGKAKCKLCPYTALSWRQVWGHMGRSHPKHNRHFSSLRAKSTSAKEELHCKASAKKGFNPSDHRPIPDRNAKYMCNICTKIYCSKPVSLKHVKTVHKASPRISSLTEMSDLEIRGKSLSCQFCSAKSNSVREYNTHLQHAKHGNLNGSTLATITKVPDPAPTVVTSTNASEAVGDTIYPCHLCGAVLLRPSSVFKHLKCVHGVCPSLVPMKGVPHTELPRVGRNVCIYCQSEFETRKHVYQHLKTVHRDAHCDTGGKLVTCNGCSLVFQNDMQLGNHIPTCQNQIETTFVKPGESTKSNQDLVYPCSKCGQVMSSLSGLENHMHNIHIVKGSESLVIEGVPKSLADSPTPKCKQCNTLFKSWGTLYSHFRRQECQTPQEPGGKYHCTTCDEYFRNQFKLDSHNDLYHDRPARSIQNRVLVKQEAKDIVVDDKMETEPTQSVLQPVIVQTNIVCPLCDKEFMEEALWSKHLRVIHRLPTSKCDAMLAVVRDKRSADCLPEAAVLSTAIPTPQKQSMVSPTYSCELCNKSFSDGTSLERHNHEMHSEGEIQPVTEACTQSTSSKDSETESTNKTEVFSCDLCDMSYHNTNGLHRHYRKMHPNRITKPLAGPNSRSANVQSFDTAQTSSSAVFSCELCDMSYHDAKGLDRHYSQRHAQQQLAKVDPGHQTSSSSSKKARCKKCSFTSNYFSNLRRHYKNVHGISHSAAEQYIKVAQESQCEQSSPVTTNNVVQAEQYNSNTSSSDSSDWMGASTEISSSSSSDDSFDDCTNSNFKGPIPGRMSVRRISSSSSSSSSDESLRGHEQRMANLTVPQPSVFNVNTKPASLPTGRNPPQPLPVKGTISVDEPLLASTAVLELDDKIFPTVKLHQEESEAENVGSETDNLPATVSQTEAEVKDNVAEKSSDSNLPYTLEEDSAIQDEKGQSLPITHETNCSSSVSTCGHFTLKTTISVNPASSSLAIQKTPAISDVTKSTRVSTSKPLSQMSNLKPDVCYGSKFEVPKANTMKSLPVAVLRPFSSVPEEVIGGLPSVSQPLRSNNRSDMNVNTVVSNIEVISSTTPVSSRNIPVYTSANSSAQLGLSSVNDRIGAYLPASYPIFLVNDTDFVVPCFNSGVYRYRRIYLTMKNGRLMWVFSGKWYDDLDKCSWRVVALLPEPMQFVDQIDKLMKWISANKIASLSCTKLYRICEIDWVGTPNTTIVTEYSTPTHAGICCKCALLVRNADERAQHQATGHPRCSKCGEDLTPQGEHSCKIVNVVACDELPTVQFINLACNFTSEHPGTNQNIPFTKVKAILPKPCLPSTVLALNSVPNASSTASMSFCLIPTCSFSSASTSTSCLASASSYSATPTSSSVLVPSSESHVNSQPVAPTSDRHSKSIVLLPKNVSARSSDEMKVFLEEHAHPYKCVICDIEFLLELQLQHHTLTHHKKCKICGAVLANRLVRSEHIIQVHNSHICLACEHTCSNSQAVKGHIIRDHVDMETGLFTCTECNNKRVHPDTIIEHLDAHDAQRALQCHICNQTLPATDFPKLRHFISHAVLTFKVACLACKTMYLEPWALRRHMLEAEHFSCPYCLFASVDKQECTCTPAGLATPIDPRVTDFVTQRTYSKYSPISRCAVCWVDVESDKIREHNDAEHAQLDVQCEVCGQRFKFGHQRTFHMAKHKKSGKRVMQIVICATCLNVQLTNEPWQKSKPHQLVINCSSCPKEVAKVLPSPTTTAESSPTAVSSPLPSPVVEVFAQDVQTVDLDSLTLEGKTYNFVAEECTSQEVAMNTDDDALLIDSASDCESEGKLVIVTSCSLREADTVDDEPAYTCKLCPYKCKFKAALNMHMTKKHASE